MADFNLRAFAEDGRWLEVAYACPCGEEWASAWSCACDDECPACGTTVEAKDWTDRTADYQPEMLAALAARRVPGLVEVRARLRSETATADDLEAAGEALRKSFAQ